MAVVLSACNPANETDQPATAPDVMTPSVATPVTASELPSAVREAETNADAEAPMLHYQCGDLLVSVRTQPDQTQISFSGRNVTLPHVPSGSGAKYDDGKGNMFWNKDEAAMLTLVGKEQGSCTRTERASPWVDAQTRGIAFRAVGSEPGWYVEVGPGAAPALH
ncbi:MAG: MliC family protein, partial [Telluria sp.]